VGLAGQLAHPLQQGAKISGAEPIFEAVTFTSTSWGASQDIVGI